jgi:hypothetical protein
VASDFAVAAEAQLQSKLGEPPVAPPGGPESFIAVTRARTQFDVQAAAFLLESLYGSRGYLVPSLDASPESDFILIAAEGGAVAGTLTLRVDGPAGLRADESYGDKLDAVRSQGRRACELGRLAVARNARSMPVIRALFGHAYEIVHGLRELTDIFIEVNPRHATFYRRAFGFRVAAGERLCPRVLAPSVLLRLELAPFEARLRDSGERPTPFGTHRAFMDACASRAFGSSRSGAAEA